MQFPPIRTHLPGEQYLKTFDAKFRVAPQPALRTTPFIHEAPMADYRSRVFATFEASKGTIVDVHI